MAATTFQPMLESDLERILSFCDVIEKGGPQSNYPFFQKGFSGGGILKYRLHNITKGAAGCWFVRKDGVDIAMMGGGHRDWDTRILGVPAYCIYMWILRPQREEARRELCRAMIEKVLGLCREEGEEFIWTQVLSADPGCISAFHAAGFVEVDVVDEYFFDFQKDTFHWVEPKVKTRTATPADRERLLEIASNAYTHQRFYNDPNLPKEKAGEIYKEWISGRCTESPENVIVAEVDGEVAGYFTYQTFGPNNPYMADPIGIWEIIGVDTRFRGLGIGTDLMVCGTRKMVDAGARYGLARISSQNTAITHVLDRLGILKSRPDLSYQYLHYWVPDAGT